MHERMRTVAGLGFVVGLAACSGASVQTASPRATSASFGEGVVEAGGVALHVVCMGAGSPTVVFDAGLGNTGAIWHDVQLEVAGTTRACVYDRAGLGGSGPARRPHTSRQMVAELRAVLDQANIRGPHVLVGHSLGGLNMRLYAAEHGAAGLVLVDSVSEDQDSRFWSLVPPASFAGFRQMLSETPEGLDYEAFRESMAQVRASKRSLGDVPLVVLTHAKADPPVPGGTPELSARMAQVWSEMQADLRRLSTNAVQIVAPNSGHFIQRDAPKLVAAAIREVIDAARTKRRVDAAKLTPLAGEGPPP